MTEHIKREAVINRIKEYASDVYGIDLDDPLQFAGNSVGENFCEGLYEATELVNAIPAADAVPVVRCKDCKYYDRSECYHPRHERHLQSICQEDDDFCSYGEGKEEM